MDFENEEGDRLKFQHLAGGKILEHPPLYAKTGEHLMFLSDKIINVYSTTTGLLVRKLVGSTTPLVDFELDLDDGNIVVACNKSGDILTWFWKTGQLKSTVRIADVINGKVMVVTNFKLLNMYGDSELSYAFVCVKITNEPILWRVVDRTTGNFIMVHSDLKLVMKTPLIAVDTKNFPTLVVAQGFYVYFINYKTWAYKRLMNAHKVPITALQMHSSEECVATGDELGKIFLWRNFTHQKELKTTLYHWHHTKVTSIAFTTSGANFYSSGEEAVMVKWHIQRPEIKQYLPRMVSKICHIVVNPDNTTTAVCTADNSVHFVGSEKLITQNLQEFTFIPDDKTGSSKYPVGLRLNPRTNTLVLNGRTGSLQFYNTYTKSLLYNMNVVQQNMLSVERDRILYDIRVTKAAFNIDWMATGEVFNDEEHLPEIRLKFWKYQEESQSYALNTNIELPHEGGFKAIEFSNDYQVENLLCATVGADNIIKMWSLEDSDNIYKEGKTWYCIAQTSYKDLPVESISFSQDGSLLAAGYGNTLCIYKSDNLKLKAALTGSNGMDGCVTKAQIRVPSKNINGAKTELQEKRKKIMKLFSNMLDTNEDSNEAALIKELQTTLNDKKSKEDIEKPMEKLDDKQKTALYKKILQLHELNLFQKVLLYQKLGIACKVHPQMETKVADYLQKTVSEKRNVNSLHSQVHRLNLRQRFKAKYRLQQHNKRQHNYDTEITEKLVPILSLLNLEKTTNQKQLTNGVKNKDTKTLLNRQHILPPKPTIAEISQVQFAAGDYAHLVAVCTERRVLIWNLLTLRLQSVLKLTVKHLSFDPQTNLMAAVTENNDLHLFQPNVPLPIYQRRNLPNLFGIAWIPRRYPKQRSINLDWQAQSTLYFLTENQEIIFLSSPNEPQSDVPASITFDNVATDSIRYSTFGTYATKNVTDKQSSSRSSGPLVLGNSNKTAVKALIDMSCHTMPPMSLMCEDFVKCMVKSADSLRNDNSSTSNATGDDALTTRLNGDINGFGSHTDDDDDDDNDGDIKMTNGSPTNTSSSMKIRKDLMNKTEELKRKQKLLGINEKNQQPPAHNDDEETKLRFIATQAINLDF